MGERRLRWHTLWLGLGWVLIGLVVWLSLMSSPPDLELEFEHIDKLEHVVTYAALMGWFGQLYVGRALKVWALILLVLGAALEGLQGLGGTRIFDLADMAANAAGIGVALALSQTRLSHGLVWLERRLLGQTRSPRYRQ